VEGDVVDVAAAHLPCERLGVVPPVPARVGDPHGPCHGAATYSAARRYRKAARPAARATADAGASAVTPARPRTGRARELAAVHDEGTRVPTSCLRARVHDTRAPALEALRHDGGTTGETSGMTVASLPAVPALASGDDHVPPVRREGKSGMLARQLS